FGGGALTAGLLLATRNTLGPVKRVLIMGGMGMCLFQIFLSFSTTLFSSVLILMFVGFCTVIFTTSGNSTLQMNVPDHLRGRVMSAYSLAFAGVTPIGSFLSGSIANWWGAPTALSFGALMGIILFTMVLFWDRRKKNRFLQKG
ncbi:MAG: MFS transporter, partial [Atribacterota bacterium]